MEEDGASEAEEETVARPDVLTKYKMAGRLVDEVLDRVCAEAHAGANAHALSSLGDQEMKRSVMSVFGKARTAEGRKLARGVCFPCTVSVNNVLCHYAPASAEDAVVLRAGDVVKVHVGCHIDGYPVSAGRTVVLPAAADGTADGTAAEGAAAAAAAVEAARVALAVVIHTIRPDVTNDALTDAIARVGAHYHAEPVEGVLSTRTKRWLPDAVQSVICRRVTKEEPQQDVAPVRIQPHQVWALDVAFTNAPTYRMQRAEVPTTIFRRNEIPSVGDLRIQSAVELQYEITQNFQCFPFHANHTSAPNRARLGLRTLLKAGLVDELPVLQCRQKYVTTRFSATVVVSDKRVNILCGDPTRELVVEQIHHGSTPNPAVPLVFQNVINESLSFAERDRGTQPRPAKKRREDPSAVAEAPAAAEE